MLYFIKGLQWIPETTIISCFKFIYHVFIKHIQIQSKVVQFVLVKLKLLREKSIRSLEELNLMTLYDAALLTTPPAPSFIHPLHSPEENVMLCKSQSLNIFLIH